MSTFHCLAFGLLLCLASGSYFDIKDYFTDSLLTASYPMIERKAVEVKAPSDENDSINYKKKLYLVVAEAIFDAIKDKTEKEVLLLAQRLFKGEISLKDVIAFPSDQAISGFIAAEVTFNEIIASQKIRDLNKMPKDEQKLFYEAVESWHAKGIDLKEAVDFITKDEDGFVVTALTCIGMGLFLFVFFWVSIYQQRRLDYTFLKEIEDVQTELEKFEERRNSGALKKNE